MAASGEDFPHLVRAVITSEDARFCEHEGVDWDALEGQIQRLNAGEEARGASTITMQLAKNLFLWGDRSFIRKGLELPTALMIDQILTKRRIMELYLNVAEWGEGIFGAEAAAQAWFGKSAADLTPAEASRLATALPNPVLRNPARPGRGMPGWPARISAAPPLRAIFSAAFWPADEAVKKNSVMDWQKASVACITPPILTRCVMPRPGQSRSGPR
ncbi:monofunctional biosynthetic peptidoglycan transglycosylase [Pannonibacter sp. Pt2-lr]